MKRLKYLGIFVFVIGGLMLFSGVASAVDNCCNVYSPGFWKNHDWPAGISTITIGNDTVNVTYTQAQGQALMSLPVKGDKRLTLFKALMAAKLNDVLNPGIPNCCISSKIIPAADEWFAAHPIPPDLPDDKHPIPGGTAVPASSPDWQDCECGCEGPHCGGESLYLQLEEYNDGDLCKD